VLLVDDDRLLCDTLSAGLRSRGYDARYVTSGEAALEQLAGANIDVVVTDLTMEGMDGLAVCDWIVQNRANVPVILLTAFGNFERAVGAIRVGAYDFISKPVKIDVLAMAVGRAASHRALRTEVKVLRSQLRESGAREGIVGESAPMRHVYGVLDRVADTDTTVLLTGESGTGKEVVARAIHRRSRRGEGPFIAVNCAATPATLLESELFGHARGAFTDARDKRDGLLVQADGGTLLLDELGDMPIELQPKLLRVLQDRCVRPLGARSEIEVDVRIIASTNRDLELAMEERRFREDLYFRISVVQIELPPLRARQADILPLAQHFLRQFAERLGRPVTGLSPAAAEKLLAYAWPGNVRELRNAIERAVTLTHLDVLSVEDLPEKVRTYHRSHVVVAAEDPTELVSLEELERRYVQRVLAAVGGNKAAAARVLGIERKTLYRKFEQWQRVDGLPSGKMRPG
jgi:two-component system response regulator AtoC